MATRRRTRARCPRESARYRRGFVPEGNRWHVVTGANYVVDKRRSVSAGGPVHVGRVLPVDRPSPRRRMPRCGAPLTAAAAAPAMLAARRRASALSLGGVDHPRKPSPYDSARNQPPRDLGAFRGRRPRPLGLPSPGASICPPATTSSVSREPAVSLGAGRQDDRRPYRCAVHVQEHARANRLGETRVIIRDTVPRRPRRSTLRRHVV